LICDRNVVLFANTNLLCISTAQEIVTSTIENPISILKVVGLNYGYSGLAIPVTQVVLSTVLIASQIWRKPLAMAPDSPA